MKGFIETKYAGYTRSIAVNQIVAVVNEGKRASIYTTEGEDNCYFCDESYDEIKQKIEKAQSPYPESWFDAMHPDTPLAEGDVRRDQS